MSDSSTIRSVQTARGPIEVRERGSGFPVVYVHGGQESCLADGLDEVLPLDELRLIVPSRPGYRGTPLQGRNTAAATADLLAALLDSLGEAQAAVIGVSLGGRPAIELAGRHPDRVRGLVLGSAVSGPWLEAGDPGAATARWMFRPGIERFAWTMTRLGFRLAPRRMARTLFAQLSTFDDPDLGPESVEEIRRRVGLLRSYAGFAADLDHALSEGALARVACPTLIQHSRNDGSVGMEHAARCHKEIDGSSLETYDNAWGHFLWFGEGSDAPSRDLVTFLRTVTR
jgi:pimeloyl-ACP methyl ester carboxylesterase